MRLTWDKADWKRVIKFYAFYALLIAIMSWPFCLPSGACRTPFEWLWDPYLAGSSTPRFIIVVGFEFYVSLMVALCVRFKDEQVDEEPDDDNREFLNKIGLVIPCHKSAEVIGATLELALHHFPPENIVVMDNGRQKTPMDNCLEEVRKVSPVVLYRWVPVGHKAVALMMGSRLLPENVEYMLLIDDDVLIPRSMRFDSSYFDDEKVSCVAYSIGGCGPDNTPDTMNLVQRFQDFEFKLADTYRCFISQHSTIMFAHGAVGLWRKQRFQDIYSIHPGLPIGEDGWAGRLNLMHGYKMKQDSGPIVRTEVPPDLCPKEWWLWTVKLWRRCTCQKREEETEAAVVAGYGSPDLFNQRARRWDMNSPRRIKTHLGLFLSYGWNQFRKMGFRKGLVFNLLFRLSILRGGWTLFGAMIYISYLARIVYSSDTSWVILLLLVLYALQVVKYILVNFWVWRNRKDLRVAWSTMCLMPLYRKIMVLYRCYGYFRSILKYIPIIKTPEKVLGEREDLIEAWPGVRDQTDADFIGTAAFPSTIPLEEEEREAEADEDEVVSEEEFDDGRLVENELDIPHGGLDRSYLPCALVEEKDIELHSEPSDTDFESDDDTVTSTIDLSTIPYGAEEETFYVRKRRRMPTSSLFGIRV